MKVFKIGSEFCTDDKVQITLNHAPTQLICSKDGYLFYKFDDLTVHRYLTDPQRRAMPHYSIPSSDLHANHLFKFNQPYVFFTPYDTSHVPESFIEDTYHVRFLYFMKLPNGDAVYADTTHFDSSNKETLTMSLEEVNKFLFDISDHYTIGKYIVDWNAGVKYAKSKNETFMVDKYPALSYESILSHYNKIEKIKNPSFEAVSAIDEVKEHTLTIPTLGYDPLLVVISENAISTFIFKITFCGKDKFKVDINSGKVNIAPDEILKRAQNLPYADTFNDYYLFYKRLESMKK